ncbi:hypothetical protein D3C74_201930 [compost metagenome]
MEDNNILQYIERYILKSGEQLDINYCTASLSSTIIDIVIVKQTARTFRKVGLLTLSVDMQPQHEELPDPSLLKWTLHKRAVLQDEAQAFDWLSQGWILKEMRFKQDEKTIDRAFYRMGYRLFSYLQHQEVEEKQSTMNQLYDYQVKAIQLIEKLSAHNHTDRIVQLSPLLHRITVTSHWRIEDMEVSNWFPMSWGTVKRIRYLVFALALIDISCNEELFDWKEIGARYYGEIGGSKTFDSDKEEFINLLEEWTGKPVSTIGMVSLGKITPLFFAGNLIGEWSNFRPGPVHALTDLSIAQDHYRTDAKILWLVENRAILTRIAAENNFIQDTGSLVVCVDGHLRSSHKHFIQDVIHNSDIQQVLLWSDYDADGLLIAHEMMKTVSEHKLILKWISHDHQVIGSWSVYERYMKELLQKKRLEQEQVLGRSEDWRRWINL